MRLLLVLALLLLAAPGWADPVPDLSGVEWVQHPGAALPLDAPLTDAAGRASSLRQAAAGRVLILAPGYFHCPNLCGVVRDDLFAALAGSGLRAGRDYSVALVTIDPAETPADAAAAVAGIEDRYPAAAVQALTGPASSLAAITAAAGFRTTYDAQSREFYHPAGLLLASPAGVISSYLLGVGYGGNAVAAAVALARDGGSALAAPIHLLCFSYDPNTGRLSLAIMDVVRLMAVLTVLTIGGFIWRLVRRP